MADFEMDSDRVSLAGRVTGPDGAPVAGAPVALISFPPELAKHVETRRLINRRARRKVLPPLEETTTAADGIFVFTRLPQGQYTVSAAAPGRRSKLAASKQVEVGSPENRGRLASVELKLSNPEAPAAPRG